MGPASSPDGRGSGVYMHEKKREGERERERERKRERERERVRGSKELVRKLRLGSKSEACSLLSRALGKDTLAQH